MDHYPRWTNYSTWVCYVPIKESKKWKFSTLNRRTQKIQLGTGDVLLAMHAVMVNSEKAYSFYDSYYDVPPLLKETRRDPIRIDPDIGDEQAALVRELSKIARAARRREDAVEENIALWSEKYLELLFVISEQKSTLLSSVVWKTSVIGLDVKIDYLVDYVTVPAFQLDFCNGNWFLRHVCPSQQGALVMFTSKGGVLEIEVEEKFVRFKILFL